MVLSKNNTFQEMLDVLNGLPVNPNPSASGNAQPSQVLEDIEFSNVDNVGLIGTMPDKSGTITEGGTRSVNGNNLEFLISENGYYDTNSKLYKTDNDWIEANIKKDVNIFGKTGTLEIKGISGVKSAYRTITVTGLSFKPHVVYIDADVNGTNSYFILYLFRNSNIQSIICQQNGASYSTSPIASGLGYYQYQLLNDGFSWNSAYECMIVANWYAIGI